MPTASGHTTAIRASRVVGTRVFGKSGDPLGEVEDVILDKTGNAIMFAVISVAGALTSTDNFYPVPWSALDYDEATGGYKVPYTPGDLAAAAAEPAISKLVENDGAAGRQGAAKLKQG
jgi:sporulation protein YlmC with PRC-barrel domain